MGGRRSSTPFDHVLEPGPYATGVPERRKCSAGPEFTERTEPPQGTGDSGRAPLSSPPATAARCHCRFILLQLLMCTRTARLGCSCATTVSEPAFVSSFAEIQCPFGGPS